MAVDSEKGETISAALAFVFSGNLASGVFQVCFG